MGIASDRWTRVLALFGILLLGAACRRRSPPPPSRPDARAPVVDPDVISPEAWREEIGARGMSCRSQAECGGETCIGPPSRPAAPGIHAAIGTCCEKLCARDADCSTYEKCNGWGSRWNGPGRISMNPFTRVPMLFDTDGGTDPPPPSGDSLNFCVPVR
jgi:hypothetical protein